MLGKEKAAGKEEKQIWDVLILQKNPMKNPHNILSKWTTERGKWPTKKKVQQRNEKC